jgi:hypothetical protein
VVGSRLLVDRLTNYLQPTTNHYLSEFSLNVQNRLTNGRSSIKLFTDSEYSLKERMR